MMHQFSWCKQCFIQTFSPQLQWLQETKSFQLGFGDKHCMQQQRMQKLGSKMIIFSILPFANWPQVFLRDICLWIKKLSCYQHLLSLPWNWGLALLSPTCEKVETVNQGAHFLRLFDFDFSKYWEMWNCQPSCTLHIFTLQYWQLSQAILGDVKSWTQKQMLTWLTSSKHMDLMH